MYITITKIVKIKWRIKGYDDFGFGEDNKLYNLKRGVEKIQTLNSSVKGYWIGRKFYTLEKLKPLLYKDEMFDFPSTWQKEYKKPAQ